MYRAFGLLQKGNDFSLEAAAVKLAAKFPDFNILRDGNTLSVAKGDWEIHWTYNDRPEVLAESQLLAEELSGVGDGGDIASCSQRVEISSDIPDPEMEHFNDYLGTVEVLMSFRGVLAVDPEEPSLL